MRHPGIPFRLIYADVSSQINNEDFLWKEAGIHFQKFGFGWKEAEIHSQKFGYGSTKVEIENLGLAFFL